MEIKVLSSCCGNPDKIVALIKEVAAERGISANVTAVSDMKEILSYGVMKTPGLVVDGKVVVAGRVPSRAELAGWLGAQRSS